MGDGVEGCYVSNFMKKTCVTVITIYIYIYINSKELLVQVVQLTSSSNLILLVGSQDPSNPYL